VRNSYDIFWYILEHGEVHTLEFKQMLEQNFKPETGAKLMTLAEQFRQEGRQEGIGLGKQEQAFASVKRLLSMNLLSPTEIAKAVGLSLEDVLCCQEEA
jgi:predicted transposase/invertase (TIGR01784 family)